MGAFILYNNKLDVSKSLKYFNNKKLTSNITYKINNWTLIVYAKVLETYPQVYTVNNNLIVVIGTMCYKTYGIVESRIKLLDDFINNKIDYNSIKGHYNIIFNINNKLYILCDDQNVKHIYCDNECNIFSSSLFAIAMSYLGKLTINKLALIEKLITGIVVPPETIFNEIYQINDYYHDLLKCKNFNIKFISYKQKSKNVTFDNDGIKNSINDKNKYLLDYLHEWNSFVKESNGLDIGLSAGYDSTLLFSLLFKEYYDYIHIHTHSTGHVHDHEKNATICISNLKNKYCNIVETHRLNSTMYDIDKILDDNIYFFDGMTSFDIAGFSETYSCEYLISSSNGSRFSMSGVGGELYRNKFGYSNRNVSLLAFLSNNHFCEGYNRISSSDIVQESINNHVRKSEILLDCKLSGTVSPLTLRRYYSEILMPEGQGHAIDAYNTVYYCLAPFLEKSVIMNGYKSILYNTIYNNYEGKMINALDPEVAECISSYGYKFNTLPMSILFKKFMMTHLPKQFLKILYKKFHRINCDITYNYYCAICDNCPSLKSEVKKLKDFDFSFDINAIIKDRRVISNFSYIARLLSKCEVI